VHAVCIEDMWQVAVEIARRAGGDRGHPGLMGPDVPPEPVKPQRLIVMQTEGWAALDGASKAAFEALVERIEDAGITVLRRGDHPLIEGFELGIAQARAIGGAITAWENHWGHRNLVALSPDGVSARTKAVLAAAEAMTPGDYAARLIQREEAQRRHAAIAPLADAVISLASPGPAPVWEGDRPGQPPAARPTGDHVFNAPSSMLFAPVVTVPLMAVGGLPVGLQMMGQREADARTTATARWLLERIEPVEG
jgi:Asp-tRNA(Asn)/Glu-tRNA(Gln) amidotransferase A subunit family amidase